jgi:pyridinium-3,5-biscarboxylic acid mononucleotide sulfurtransferase
MPPAGILPAAAGRIRGNLLTAQLAPGLQASLARLQDVLRTWPRVVVLFSGGVDSTLLLKVAVEVVGPGVTALTFQGPQCPFEELARAREIALHLGVRHWVEVYDPFILPDFRHNTPNRCYACKQAMYHRSWEIAALVEAAALLDGAHADDAAGDRPGLLAAAAMGVRSPLRETGWRKDQIRDLSRLWRLPGWDRPAQSCLATRFPTHTHLDPETLQKVDQVETWLRHQGLGPVRLRVHGDLVRLELPPEQWLQVLDPAVREAISGKIKNLGWRYLALDLQGYQSGSMNVGPQET